jgi:hypothetical protein
LTVRLKLGKQDLDFKELRSQYEKPQARKTQCNKQEGLENLLANKGKKRRKTCPLHEMIMPICMTGGVRNTQTYLEELRTDFLHEGK